MPRLNRDFRGDGPTRYFHDLFEGNCQNAPATLVQHRDPVCKSNSFSFFDQTADQIIVPEEQRINFSSLLVEGPTCRSKYMENGERQIMEIDVPGDFVDLYSYPLEWLDHSVTSLTPCKIAKLPHDKITELISADPRLGRILWFATMVDASIHREWLVCIVK
jgi:CRP-like cAMP-binding protein